MTSRATLIEAPTSLLPRTQGQGEFDEDSNDELSDGVGGKVGGPVVEGREEVAKVGVVQHMGVLVGW